MSQDVKKIEEKIKALQAKKRQATKKAKEAEMKAELGELRAYKEKNDKHIRQGSRLNDMLVKYGVKTFDEGFEILERALLSQKQQQ